MSYKGLFMPEVPPNLEHKGCGLFVLDSADQRRIGDLSYLVDHMESAVIDHHSVREKDLYGNIRYLCVASPSTTLMVQRVIESASQSLTKKEAEWVLFGFLTDSGFFRHIDTNGEEIFSYISRILSHDVSLRKFHHKLYGNRQLSEHRLLGYLLTNVQSYLQDRLLITRKSREIVEKCGTPFLNHGLLYDHLLNTVRVEVCVLISELPHGSGFDVSLRSSGAVDVNAVAGQFGGGGHTAASGFRWGKGVEELEENLIGAITEALGD